MGKRSPAQLLAAFSGKHHATLIASSSEYENRSMTFAKVEPEVFSRVVP